MYAEDMLEEVDINPVLGVLLTIHPQLQIEDFRNGAHQALKEYIK